MLFIRGILIQLKAILLIQSLF